MARVSWRDLVMLIGFICGVGPWQGVNADVGIRDFADTIFIDDPEPSDQLVGPTISWQRFGATQLGDTTQELDFDLEIEKRITPSLGLQLGYGGSLVWPLGGGKQSGFQNLVAGLQYELFQNAAHEFIISLGVMREFGATGTARVGAERTGTTMPVVFLGKGLGELPFGLLRPIAITGELGYAFSDKLLKPVQPAQDQDSDAGVTFNNGREHRWVGGFTVQYPLSYLDNEVLRLHLPEWLTNITPLVEVAWSSPASSPSLVPTQWIIAPGVIWSNGWFQMGVEALVPGNGASGKGIGVIGQFRMALGVIAPALNRPIFPRR